MSFLNDSSSQEMPIFTAQTDTLSAASSSSWLSPGSSSLPFELHSSSHDTGTYDPFSDIDFADLSQYVDDPLSPVGQRETTRTPPALDQSAERAGPSQASSHGLSSTDHLGQSIPSQSSPHDFTQSFLTSMNNHLASSSLPEGSRPPFPTNPPNTEYSISDLHSWISSLSSTPSNTIVAPNNPLNPSSLPSNDLLSRTRHMTPSNPGSNWWEGLPTSPAFWNSIDWSLQPQNLSPPPNGLLAVPHPSPKPLQQTRRNLMGPIPATEILEPVNSQEGDQTGPQAPRPQCSRCGTEHSSRFAPNYDGRMMCNVCRLFTFAHRVSNTAS